MIYFTTSRRLARPIRKSTIPGSKSSIPRFRNQLRPYGAPSVVVVVAVMIATLLVSSPAQAEPHTDPADCEPVIFIGVRESGAAPGHGPTVWSGFEALEDRLPPELTPIEQRWLEYPALGTRTMLPEASILDLKSGVIGISDALASGADGITEYVQSIEEGRINLIYALRDISRRCHSSWIVLSGYSQGAIVIRQALGGLASDRALIDKIVGVSLFGDPGASQNDGLTHRAETTGLNGIYYLLPGAYVPSVPTHNGVWDSWCFPGDPVCSWGLTDLAVQVYRQDLAHGAYESAGAPVFSAQKIADHITHLHANQSAATNNYVDQQVATSRRLPASATSARQGRCRR